VGQKLTVGWLWFDNDSGRTLEEKVAQAAQKYREKFGHAPDTCCVNPAAMAEDERQVNGLRVVAVRHVLPHHFFVGVAGRERESK
jgi:hypothetical protein